MSSWAGGMHAGAWFILNQCIFIEVFVLFFPLHTLEASGTGSFSIVRPLVLLAFKHN